MLIVPALTHPEGDVNLPIHRICLATRDSLGWIGSLLLGAVAGCCTVPPVQDIPTTAAHVQSETSDVSPPVLASSDDFALAPTSNRGEPGMSGLCEAAQPIRLASLETDLPSNRFAALSLEDAINWSLERNPDLAAVRAGEAVAQAALHVAETYPWNPQFQTQVAPYSRDRNGNDGAIAQQHVLVQTFELGGQRRFRVGAAAANWAQVNGTIRQAELTTAAQTARLFFATLYQRELLHMSQSLADLNEQLVGVIQRRLQAGQANNANVQLARLQAQSSRRQQRLAEANYQTALMNLRNQLNLDSDAPLELAGPWVDQRWRALDDVIGVSLAYGTAGNSGAGSPEESGDDDASISPDDDWALRQLLVERPDAMAARAAVAMASENVRLANAMRRPDLQIGPMWQRDEASTEFWGVQAQMDIPVVNTGAALVEQRMAELRQQEINAARLENRAVLEARAAFRRYERARRLVELSRGEFAHAVSDTLQPFEDQFKAGQISLLEVLAARAALAQSQQSFLDLLNELALAAADVTQATGVPPHQLLADVEPQPVLFEEAPQQ